MRIDNPEKEAPTKRICESSCSLLFADGERCPWYERETPGLLYRPATRISVYLSLSTWQRCLSMHMRLEVWQPDLHPRSRELALQLSEDPPFKNESLP
jgi:hypothetical protein